jgi:hypothetical protein
MAMFADKNKGRILRLCNNKNILYLSFGPKAYG